MDSASSLPAFIHNLLTTQAMMVAGTEAVAFAIQRQGDQLGLQTIEHIRPDQSDQEVRAQAIKAFQNIVGPCVAQGKDGAFEVGNPDGGADTQYCLVTLLRSEGSDIAAVSAVITRCRDAERARQRLNSMQIVAGYFELFFLRKAVDQAKLAADRHQHVLQFSGAVSTAEGFDSSASNLCNELANRTGASRVSLGWLKHSKIKIKALSHTEKFDKKQELIVDLEKTMEECLDQEEPVRYVPSGVSGGGESTANVTRSAKDLSGKYGGNTVLSIPLRRRDEICGVMTLEFPPENPLDEARELAIGVGSEVLAPQLFDRYENDRIIFVKIWHSFLWLIGAAKGPKYWTAKLIIIACIAAACAVTFIRPMYHVRASMLIKAMEWRTLTAPYEGTIESVNIRPGQSVKKGDILAKMETFENKSRRNSAEMEAIKQGLEADRNRSAGKTAEMKAALAARDEALAQRDLYDYMITQAEIVAPFDGTVTRGDLFDRKGAAVKLGESLFEIVKADPKNPELIENEAEIQISERDIQKVREIWKNNSGKVHGKLATSSQPSDEFEFVITRIVPDAESKDGENLFKAFATIKSPAPWMHPGLAGEAEIDIEPSSIAWIYSHRLWEWLVLKKWTWTP